MNSDDLNKTITKEKTVDFAEKQLENLNLAYEKASFLIDKIFEVCLVDDRQLKHYREIGASIEEVIQFKKQANLHRPNVNSIKNQFRKLIDQTMDAEKSVHQLNVQLMSYIKQYHVENSQILSWSQRVNQIYDQIQDLNMHNRLKTLYASSISKCGKLYDVISRLDEAIKPSGMDTTAFINNLTQLAEEKKDQLAQKQELLHQLDEPITPTQKLQLAQIKEEIKQIEETIKICRPMRRFKLKSGSMECRPTNRYRTKLVPCPSQTRWCNYCVKDLAQCTSPKFKKVAGTYQMKPSVAGFKMPMYPEGQCATQYSSKHHPCPTDSHLRNYCVTDLNQCQLPLHRLGKKHYSKKVPQL